MSDEVAALSIIVPIGALVFVTGGITFGLPHLDVYLDRRKEKRNMERNGYQLAFDFDNTGDIYTKKEPLVGDREYRWTSILQV